MTSWIYANLKDELGFFFQNQQLVNGKYHIWLKRKNIHLSICKMWSVYEMQPNLATANNVPCSYITVVCMHLLKRLHDYVV